MEIECTSCKKRLEHHAKQMCFACYKKNPWKPKKGICKRCKRDIFIHAKGFCSGCYNSVYNIDKLRQYYLQKHHNIPISLIKEVTNRCAVCGFDKVIALHPLDNNHKNNIRENLVGLCPNHHKMIHHKDYFKEVTEPLKKQGYLVAEPFASDELLKG